MKEFLGENGDILANYVQMIHIPDDVMGVPEDARLSTLLKYLTDSAIIIYQSSTQINDFFLLHGVTSSFALTQVLTLLGDEEQCLESIRTWLCVLIAVYIAERTPKLDMGRLEEGDVDGVSWDSIKSRILYEEGHPRLDADAHITKLVEVCYERSLDNADVKMASVYKRAALTAMDNPFTF